LREKQRFDEIHPERFELPAEITPGSAGTFQNKQNDFRQDSH